MKIMPLFHLLFKVISKGTLRGGRVVLVVRASTRVPYQVVIIWTNVETYFEFMSAMVSNAFLSNGEHIYWYNYDTVCADSDSDSSSDGSDSAHLTWSDFYEELATQYLFKLKNI